MDIQKVKVLGNEAIRVDGSRIEVIRVDNWWVGGRRGGRGRGLDFDDPRVRTTSAGGRPRWHEGRRIVFVVLDLVFEVATGNEVGHVFSWQQR
jgi:hypothetical protein